MSVGRVMGDRPALCSAGSTETVHFPTELPSRPARRRSAIAALRADVHPRGEKASPCNPRCTSAQRNDLSRPPDFAKLLSVAGEQLRGQAAKCRQRAAAAGCCTTARAPAHLCGANPPYPLGAAASLSRGRKPSSSLGCAPPRAIAWVNASPYDSLSAARPHRRGEAPRCAHRLRPPQRWRAPASGRGLRRHSRPQ